MSGTAFADARRTLSFLRHVPPRRLLRRAELTMRRAIRDVRGGYAPPTPEACPVARPPLPLMAPRVPSVSTTGQGVAFRFLGFERRFESIDEAWSDDRRSPSGQLWRMNLHYMEYLEACDDEQFTRIVQSWLTANDRCAPGAWRDGWNAYALSLRVVVWMQQLAARHGRLEATLVEAMHESLTRQLAYLRRNLETDLGGNHLIKNAKALIWASCVFDGLAADEWRATGLGLLKREIGHQVLADGMHVERSPSYHCQVFVDLLECRHALGHDPFDGELDDIFLRMGQVVADLQHPDECVPLFNDAGLSMAYPPSQCLDALERTLGSRPRPRSGWALPEAGYWGLRTASGLFVADCGPIGPDELPAHSHGDVLSFEWSVGGRRIIVDQGVYEYVAGPKRQRSRSASSHNTLWIEGIDQAEFFGAFRCGRRPEVRCTEASVTSERLELVGRHDGFRRMRGSPIHERRFDVSADELVIEDRLLGDGDANAFVGSLLHPEVEATVNGRRAELVSGDVRILMEASVPIVKEAAVWWPDMGIEHPTTRLTLAVPNDTPRMRASLTVGGRRMQREDGAP